MKILFHITFNSLQGDIPNVILSDPNTTVNEIKKGRSQIVIGKSSYSTMIEGLSTVHQWFVRVFAYNINGGGNPGNAHPFPVQTHITAPSIVQNFIVIL